MTVIRASQPSSSTSISVQSGIDLLTQDALAYGVRVVRAQA